MFKEASDRAQASASQIENELYDRLEGLEKTATSWFDNTSDSVIARRDQLHRAASLSYRLASFPTISTEDAEDLQAVSESYTRQAKQLNQLVADLKAEEYQDRHGDGPQFSSKGLTDESRTAVRRETDWDLYMAVEPRSFVASNPGVSAQELQTRAYNFMEGEVSGHGMSRKAKAEVIKDFLSHCEMERRGTVKKSAKEVSEPVRQYADSDLFI